jgi:hypothetical protein
MIRYDYKMPPSRPIKKERKPMIDQQIAILDNALNMVEAALEAPPKSEAIGPRVVFQTVHYQISDHGENWKGRWMSRYFLERKPEYAKSRVMKQHARSNESAEHLLDALHAAENFHLESMPFCGGF